MDRAQELYDYLKLVDLVKSGRIPHAQGKKGGIGLVGWSLGSTHISSLLANVVEFAVGDVHLSDYVRRIVLGALEDRKAPLVDPPPTTENMTAEEHHESTYDPPCGPNGSETLLAGTSIMHGALGTLKEGAFYLRDIPPGAEDWRSVEVRYVWCENSVWGMPLGHHLLTRELEEARKAGKDVRDVSYGLIRGGNHFAHWDIPETFLTAVLGDDR
ncbi:hypothetical protein LXA43DRAFT_1099280 [Ganoderma leucocontextum]|nr:hypothetical protein LXA43DRAFT_1099280 [Ganoderma leucocontextum]